MESVVIVVPLYKYHLDAFENISLQQLKNVLGRYHICAVIPPRFLNSSVIKFVDSIECFSDVYFENTKTYSSLLLMRMFYERFIDYEYMLIYQLDAFVFSDQLEYFCLLGYDYIGAPLDRFGQYWRDLGSQVGNGGLSLRRVSAMLRVLESKDEILATHPMAKDFQTKEDLYFSYCGAIGKLKIPDVDTALQFAIEDDVRHCYRNIKDRLPFGVHGWYKDKYAICKPIIEKYGYTLPDVSTDLDVNRHRKNITRNYLFNRLFRKENLITLQLLVNKFLPRNCYGIWGIGTDGQFLLRLLLSAGKIVRCLFDKRIIKPTMYRGINLVYPNDADIKKYKSILLIGSSRFGNKISIELTEQYGFSKGDFIICKDIFNNIFSNYLFYLKEGIICDNNPHSLCSQ